MDPERETSQAAVNAFVQLQRHDSDDDREVATSVSGFAAAEQQRVENRKRSLTELNRDAIGIFHRTQPIDLTTPADGTSLQKNVEGPAARSAGTRSQYHSIQQLSQSGRPAGNCGLFPGAEAAVYGQAWIERGHYPVDVTVKGEEDTLNVLRSLLRRYDSYVEPRTAMEVFDGRGHESDEVASGRASNSDLSGDDFDEDQSPVGQQVPLTRSPSTTTLQAKRARVEHIVSNIRIPTYTEAAGATGPACGGPSTSLELMLRVPHAAVHLPVWN